MNQRSTLTESLQTNVQDLPHSALIEFAAVRRCFNILANGVTTAWLIYALLYPRKFFASHQNSTAKCLKALTKPRSDSTMLLQAAMNNPLGSAPSQL